MTEVILTHFILQYGVHGNRKTACGAKLGHQFRTRTLFAFYPHAQYLGLGDAVPSQLHDGVVAAADRSLDVVEADLDRPAAVTVIGHRDTDTASDGRTTTTGSRSAGRRPPAAHF